MTVVAYRERVTGSYPVALSTIRDNAGVLFGEEPPKALLDQMGYDAVYREDAPSVGPSEVALEVAPVKRGTRWYQSWSIGPAPRRVPAPLSRRQFFQAVAMPPYAFITTQEAIAAVTTRALPRAMQQYVDGLEASERFAATMLFAGADTFERDNPTTDAIGVMLQVSPDTLDDVWELGGTL